MIASTIYLTGSQVLQPLPRKIEKVQNNQTPHLPINPHLIPAPIQIQDPAKAAKNPIASERVLPLVLLFLHNPSEQDGRLDNPRNKIRKLIRLRYLQVYQEEHPISQKISH